MLCWYGIMDDGNMPTPMYMCMCMCMRMPIHTLPSPAFCAQPPSPLCLPAPSRCEPQWCARPEYSSLTSLPCSPLRTHLVLVSVVTDVLVIDALVVQALCPRDHAQRRIVEHGRIGRARLVVVDARLRCSARAGARCELCAGTSSIACSMRIMCARRCAVAPSHGRSTQGVLLSRR